MKDQPSEHETIIFFHANAGNIGFRLPNVSELVSKTEVNVLIIGYRGYGHSEGIPTEEGIKLDSLAIFDWAIENEVINNDKIFLFGRSLGGAVATYLCSKRGDQIQGMILENTFSSIPDMVDQIFKYLATFKRLILRIEWNSLALIKELTNPMLFISGENDQIVPPIQMAKLYEGAKKSKLKEMYKIQYGTHNESWMQAGDDYFYRIKDFIDQVNKKKE